MNEKKVSLPIQLVENTKKKLADFSTDGLKINKVAIFIPIHNEEKNVGTFIESTLNFVRPMRTQFHFYFLDNGSFVDPEPAIARALKKNIPDIKKISTSKTQNNCYSSASLNSVFFCLKFREKSAPRALNLAFKICLKCGYEFFIRIDVDTYAQAGSVYTLLQTLRNQKKRHLVGASIYEGTFKKTDPVFFEQSVNEERFYGNMFACDAYLLKKIGEYPKLISDDAALAIMSLNYGGYLIEKRAVAYTQYPFYSAKKMIIAEKRWTMGALQIMKLFRLTAAQKELLYYYRPEILPIKERVSHYLRMIYSSKALARTIKDILIKEWANVLASLEINSKISTSTWESSR